MSTEISLETLTKGMPASQREALTSMAEPLVEKYVVIRDEVFSEGKSLVQTRHRIGQIINEIVGNEPVYGEHAMEQLSTALDGTLSLSIMYECKRLASVYSYDNLSKLLDMRSPGQVGLTYNHLIRISGVGEKARRTELSKRVIREGLSVSQLDTAIRLLEHGSSGNGAVSSGPKPPKTVTAGLLQIAKLPDEMARRMSMWKRAVFERVEKAAPDDITDKTLAMIDSTTASVAHGLKSMHELQERLVTARKRVDSVLKLRSANAAKAPKKPAEKPAGKPAGKAQAAKAADKAKKAKAKAKAAKPAPPTELQPA